MHGAKHSLDHLTPHEAELLVLHSLDEDEAMKCCNRSGLGRRNFLRKMIVNDRRCAIELRAMLAF